MLKFISLLGTNQYLPCNYYFDEYKANDCCYIQEALVQILAENDIVPDKITIFTTEDSYNKNWIANAYNDTRPGLNEELNNISKKFHIPVENVMIPEGHNEEELWEIFNSILNELEEEDEIILDITHSFKYLAMLTFIVINYARIVKNCSLKAIYYGAFDVLGYTREVEKLPIEERNAPIFDLTSFTNLFDWTIAIDRYLATGDASLVKNLTSLEIKKINEKIGRKVSESNLDKSILFKDPNALRDLSKSMDNFSNTVATCRGPNLTSAISSLKESIHTVVENAAHERIKPLSPIMEMVEKKFDSFSHTDEYINTIETAKWCHENKMYQQGLTILQEGLINYVCEKWGLDRLSLTNRDKVGAIACYVKEHPIEADYKSLGLNEQNAKDLLMLIYNVGDMRNDINHAGWREQTNKVNKFSTNLKDFIQRAEIILTNDSNNVEGKYRQLLLMFSHDLTEEQKSEAKEKFNISRFIKLNDELSNKWANVPPHLDDLGEYLEEFKEWLDEKGQVGDYVLIQGDFGATMSMVEYAKSKKIIPIYATTERNVVEEKTGETIKISREFKHVMFRKY